eukprot:362480-Chlamydomonas_euryale.AAC.2
MHVAWPEDCRPATIHARGCTFSLKGNCQPSRQRLNLKTAPGQPVGKPLLPSCACEMEVVAQPRLSGANDLADLLLQVPKRSLVGFWEHGAGVLQPMSAGPRCGTLPADEPCPWIDGAHCASTVALTRR